jgi:hypothetical protein
MFSWQQTERYSVVQQAAREARCVHENYRNRQMLSDPIERSVAKLVDEMAERSPDHHGESTKG